MSVQSLVEALRSMTIEELTKGPTLAVECRTTHEERATLLAASGSVQELQLTIGRYQAVALAEFEKCSSLRTLTLSSENDKAPPSTEWQGLEGFKNPAAMTNLTCLHIRRICLMDSALPSLVAVTSLQELTLEQPELCTPSTLLSLASCRSLKRLHLKLREYPGEQAFGSVSILEELLRKGGVTLTPTPFSTHEVFNDYSTIFASKKQSAYTYAATDTIPPGALDVLKLNCREKNYWPRTEANRAENQHLWDRLTPARYDKNRVPCNFFYSGSAIMRPDSTPENYIIGAPEPLNEVTRGDFWWIVSQQVSLIVMAKKEFEETPYFPSLAKTVTYKGQNGVAVEVTCTGKEVVDDVVTIREFSVAGKPVTHLQLSWVDGKTLAVDRLQPVMSLIRDLERKGSGKTLVHCFAGWGRTGTLIACKIVELELERELERRQKSPEKEAEPILLDLERLYRILNQQRELIANGGQLKSVFEYFQILMQTLMQKK